MVWPRHDDDGDTITTQFDGDDETTRTFADGGFEWNLTDDAHTSGFGISYYNEYSCKAHHAYMHVLQYFDGDTAAAAAAAVAAVLVVVVMVVVVVVVVTLVAAVVAVVVVVVVVVVID